MANCGHGGHWMAVDVSATHSAAVTMRVVGLTGTATHVHQYPCSGVDLSVLVSLGCSQSAPPERKMSDCKER